MGCDIHLFVEAKKNGVWESQDEWVVDPDCDPPRETINYQKRFYSGRNYDLFGILADVRNGTGFAGIKTGEGFEPICQPRGVPADASPNVMAESKSWDGDGHSHSWLTVAELMAYDWTRTSHKRGVLSRDEYKESAWRIGRGEPPKSYSGGVFGKNVIMVSQDEMREMVKSEQSKEDEKSYHCSIEWDEPYYSVARSFLSETMPKLWKLGNPENVRIVFWFDN